MAKAKLKFSAQNEFGEDTDEFKENLEEYLRQLGELNGIYLLIKEEDMKDKKIYYAVDKSKYKKKIREFTKVQEAYINSQVEYEIQKKYNFIHYNGWPNITKEKDLEENIDINEFLNPDAVNKRKTANQKIAQKLIRDTAKNKKLGINSPFKDQVIVIDEIHNLINMINNKKTIPTQFYNWIKDSVDTKLIFL